MHELTSPEAAELTKLLENIFRSVNIALVNELAILCDRMGIDIWEVVDAAATKPFGFMRFSPGPGLGGHCIPIDPFYLSWKAREFGFYTEFIELAGKVNEEMPYFCRSLVSQALNHHAQRAMKGSRILVLGVAYKPDIGDLRESPALKLISLLQNAGADVSYHDPHVPRIREQGVELSSVPYEPQRLRLRRHRHRPLLPRLRPARGRGAARRRPPQRDRRQGHARRSTSSSCERGCASARRGSATGAATSRATSTTSPTSRWLCDASEERRAEFAERYPDAQRDRRLRRAARRRRRRRRRDRDARFPRTTRSRSAALEAGKHVFVEKPPAMRAAEMEELIGLAEARGLVLMPGHLLLYHPGVQKLKELDRRRASSARCSSSTATARTSARSARTRTRSGRSASTTSR